MSSMLFLTLAAALSGATSISTPIQPDPAIQAQSRQEAKRSADPQQQADVVPSIVSRGRKDPFAGLFRVSRAAARQRLTDSSDSARPSASNPRVVCGMTMWQVDPGHDALIRRVAPGHGVDPAARRIEPHACREQ
jgi:hypothetical protein